MADHNERIQAHLANWDWALDIENVPETRDFLSLFEIEAKDGSHVYFELNSVQDRVDAKIQELDAAGKPVRIIIVKARQMGCSTYSGARVFAKVVREGGQKCLIMADDEDNTEELYLSKVVELWEQIPPPVRPKKLRTNKRELVVRHGTKERDKRKPRERRQRGRSFVRVMTAGKKEAGRSRTHQHLFLSEVAFWRNADTVLKALLQTVHPYAGTSIIIESTANGASGDFYDRWKKAIEGRSSYVPMFFGWHEFPENVKPFADGPEKVRFLASLTEEEEALREEYGLTWEQLHWRRETLEDNCNGDKIIFQQEYPMTWQEAFIASGSCRFDLAALHILKQQAPEPKGRGRIMRRGGKWQFVKDHARGAIELYEPPHAGREYIVVADVAEGVNPNAEYSDDADFSYAVVRDRRSRRIMARIHKRIEPLDFATQLYRLGKWYRNALLVVERNGPGLQVIRQLVRMEYGKNLYKERKADSVQRKFVDKWGFQTTSTTRDYALTCLASEIARGRVELTDLEIRECYAFVRNDRGKWEARSGSHDDTVIANAILAAVNFEHPYDPAPPEPEDEVRKDSRVAKWERKVFRRLAQETRPTGSADPILGSEW